MSAINNLSISGFKSIRHMDQLRLGSLNVLIGANGAGKSNFVAYFRMLSELVKGRLQLWTSKQGGAERVLSYGIKETSALTTSGWKVYHFHDPSDTAGVKRRCALHDNEYLRKDAANLAAFLYRLRQEAPTVYNRIRKTVRLAVPFFDDFVLKPETLATEEQQIRLLWKQNDSDYSLWPSQLSDGSIRFICLVTALLQPNPSTTIIIDEPELGLHPYAITLLGALIRSAATRTQVIISTQSVPLLNEFSIEDLIVVEREQGASVFKRLNAEDFERWLQRLGQLQPQPQV
ncbi:AAA family ATPase [uncultured Oceanisphaera sp.]|uniref:AAA family ATPase n=1 Tax=uncultured Oceanisphaera sp. TaxID=353858 RepID=UPI00262F1FC2|nr:AAA family ATPase [uncultured Oceanisphaera sp.]